MPLSEHQRLAVKEAGLPRRFWSADHALVPEATWHRLADWAGVARREREVVYLYGPVGSGKSYLAACLMKHLLFEAEGEGRWCDWPRFIDIIRSRMESGGHALYEEAMRSIHTVVADDVMAERGTEWARDRADLFVAHRWNEVLPLVATSNWTPKELMGQAPRMASRLLSGLVIKIDGDDRRLAHAREVSRKREEE